MKRPDLAHYYKAFDRQKQPNPPDCIRTLFPKMPPFDFREAWVAACWLGDELREAGCDEELAERICFAHGQVCYHGTEPWKQAQEQLDDFRRGHWLVAGHELAMANFLGQLPQLVMKYGYPDLTALQRFIAENGLPPEPKRPFPFDIKP